MTRENKDYKQVVETMKARADIMERLISEIDNIIEWRADAITDRDNAEHSEEFDPESWSYRNTLSNIRNYDAKLQIYQELIDYLSK